MKRTWILPFGLYILAAAERPIEIGDRLELFVDDALIERLQGAELRLHSPQSAGPALVFDRPWEGLSSSMVTVFKDGGRFRMYYRGSTNKDYLIASLVKPGEQTVPDHPLFTCYAESQDGIHWTRPKLGLYEFQGSRDNNIIWTGAFSDSFAPFLDNRPGVTEGERYKAVAAKSTGKRKGALFALTSADGIHWRQLRDEPILTDGAFDTLNLAMWDPLRQLYFAFYRDFKNGVRSFKISTSTDFLRWAPGAWADFGNTPEEHIYTIAAAPYYRAPHIFLSFPRRFVTSRKFPPDSAFEGVSDVVFLSSRDGFRWNRRFMEAFLRAGLDERNWTHRSNAPGVGLVETGPAEISMYVSRHISAPTHFLERFTIRTDGFVSLNADYSGGEALTRPLVFSGKRMFLNFPTSAVGSVRVEVQDLNGNPLPGFALEDCLPIFGDAIERAVSWTRPMAKSPGQPTDVAQLAGRPVRLRFVLKDADVYSFRFQ